FNALMVPLQKKTLIPIDAAARRMLRRWLQPDEPRLLARALGKQRIWLLLAGVLWLWGALPNARHGLNALELAAGATALATALIRLVRPLRALFIGEGAWCVLWAATMVLRRLNGGSLFWTVFLLALSALWLGNVVGQFRFYGPPDEA